MTRIVASGSAEVCQLPGTRNLIHKKTSESRALSIDGP
jgi:hypothetical protein